MIIPYIATSDWSRQSRGREDKTSYPPPTLYLSASSSTPGIGGGTGGAIVGGGGGGGDDLESASASAIPSAESPVPSTKRISYSSFSVISRFKLEYISFGSTLFEPKCLYWL